MSSRSCWRSAWPRCPRSLMRRLGVNFSYLSAGGNNFGVSLLNSLTLAARGGLARQPHQRGGQRELALPVCLRRRHLDHVH